MSLLRRNTGSWFKTRLQQNFRIEIKTFNLLDIKNLTLLEIPDLDFPKFTVLDFLRYEMTAQI